MVRCIGRAGLPRLMGVAAAVWLMMAGCEGEMRTAPLTASRTPFVRDIPVPMSFELVDTMSRSDRRPGFRRIEHSYFGIVEPITAYAFYRDEMPKCGWRLLSDQNAQGIYYLSFQKGQEAAVVVVKRERRGLQRGTLVSVSVKPIAVIVTPE